jgi:hypothetical protein
MKDTYARTYGLAVIGIVAFVLAFIAKANHFLSDLDCSLLVTGGAICLGLAVWCLLVSSGADCECENEGDVAVHTDAQGNVYLVALEDDTGNVLDVIWRKEGKHE